MIDVDECGAVGGMRIGRGNRSAEKRRFLVNTTESIANPT
jgi:hypothetical protein